MKQYVQSSNYETSQLDDEWIVLNTDHFTVTRLNEVGGFCWTLLQKPHSTRSLIESIRQEYATDGQQVHIEEIEGFLTELIQCGLVQYGN